MNNQIDIPTEVTTSPKSEEQQKQPPLRVILSAGGTAGHIHPAIAVADALRAALGEHGVEILFVGALGKMEMERVPRAGYPIEGLPVAGLQRKLSLSNLALPAKLWRSVSRAEKIIGRFRPDVVAGFGGYASAPVLWSAQRRGIPTLVQEQNSYAGLTNRLLSFRARRICVAYPDMERFFPANRIALTGNPLLGSFAREVTPQKRAEALEYFGLTPERRTLLVMGGSLGTRTLNNAILENLRLIQCHNIQIIWQNGKYYDTQMTEALDKLWRDEDFSPNHMWRGAFIERMDLAYAASDLVLCRSGASTVSELELLGLPVIFVPSPNVAEDHQTKNAMALVEQGAAEMIPDTEAVERAIPRAIELLEHSATRRLMANRIARLGRPKAAQEVAQFITELGTQRS